MVGATPNVVIYLIEMPNWQAYGDFNGKLAADAEWGTFMAEVNMATPAADMLSSAVYSEIPLG
jgi:hypothetical protein